MKIVNAAVISCALISGCASTSDRLAMVNSASLNASSQAIVFRPAEYAVDELGSASGEAHVTTILGIIHTGDAVETKFSIFGAHSGDPLENLAGYRAAKSKGGDAFYQLEAHTETSGIPFISETKTVRVTGKVLKLKYAGTSSDAHVDKVSSTTNQ